MASKVISLAKYVQASPALSKLVKPVANAYANLTGHRQVGLRYDDLIVEENDQAQKAISRLSERDGYDRAFRMRRAVQCSVLNRNLPKEEWTKPEEDVRYLTPLLREVQEADDERAKWDTIKVQNK